MYWYVCVIKGFCGDAAPIAAAPTTQIVTPQDTWASVTAEPLIVYFGVNGDNVITEGVEEKLRAIVAYMQANPSARIAITGHTNIHSSNAYTYSLGMQRALKLKALLASYGAPQAAITVNSRGQSQLAAPATTEANQALNRRAVISIINN
jgi:peptidoglycan-associated lipoprotein